MSFSFFQKIHRGAPGAPHEQPSTLGPCQNRLDCFQELTKDSSHSRSLSLLYYSTLSIVSLFNVLFPGSSRLRQGRSEKRCKVKKKFSNTQAFPQLFFRTSFRNDGGQTLRATRPGRSRAAETSVPKASAKLRTPHQTTKLFQENFSENMPYNTFFDHRATNTTTKHSKTRGDTYLKDDTYKYIFTHKLYCLHDR